MPLSLSFRALIVVSAVAECDQHTFRCGNPCDFGVSQNCSPATCLSNSLLCDSIDNCGVDETGCGSPTNKSKQSEISFRYQTILSSSKLMLVGFFVLNGAFIVIKHDTMAYTIT
ncbi:hypothetical protein NECAME_12779 [Necator americanus]|uniref:Low-density lipoprotein receptor domain class A n=1 Tax=Necator americanus TaxID=51031 RepID=W2T0D5_NECAM|nr:hypothetical protein NECAME_12779 [Necator americanus]ETN74711.1 hypothetical protein NECAME_12779 [Necator americanus]